MMGFGMLCQKFIIVEASGYAVGLGAVQVVRAGRLARRSIPPLEHIFQFFTIFLENFLLRLRRRLALAPGVFFDLPRPLRTRSCVARLATE